MTKWMEHTSFSKSSCGLKQEEGGQGVCIADAQAAEELDILPKASFPQAATPSLRSCSAHSSQITRSLPFLGYPLQIGLSLPSCDPSPCSFLPGGYTGLITQLLAFCYSHLLAYLLSTFCMLGIILSLKGQSR